MYKKSVKSRIKKEDLNPVFYFQTEDDDDKVLSKALIKTALKSGNLNLANKGLGSGMWKYFNCNFELNSVLEVQKNVCFVNIPQPQGHVKKDEKSIISNLSIFVKQTLILEVFSDYLVSIIFALHNEVIIIWFFFIILDFTVKNSHLFEKKVKIWYSYIDDYLIRTFPHSEKASLIK